MEHLRNFNEDLSLNHELHESHKFFLCYLMSLFLSNCTNWGDTLRWCRMPASRGFSTKTIKTPLSLSVAFGLRAELLSALMRASSQRSLLSSSLLRCATQPAPSENTPFRCASLKKGAGCTGYRESMMTVESQATRGLACILL